MSSQRAERRSVQEAARDQDPYNRPYASQQQQHYLSHEDEDQQFAYDSMSTILEVDSEGTGSDRSGPTAGRRLESPLHIRTESTPTAGVSSSAAAGDRDDSSPVTSLLPDDKFKGTLSALAEQMERLKRSSAGLSPTSKQSSSPPPPQVSSKIHPGARDVSQAASSASRTTTTSDSETAGSEPEPSGGGGQRDVSTSPPALGRDGDEDDDALLSPGSAGPTPSGMPLGRAGSRPPSTESLMMITLSPMASPRVKFPLLRSVPLTTTTSGNRRRTSATDGDGAGDEEERRLVEVSNKSTITAIDLALMDRMVQKYFVETSEKATQSIKFDCDDGDTIELSARDGSLRRRSVSGGLSSSSTSGGRPVVMKSIAVGTEKFSRERFSLLPPTKSRSTQTKANLDRDIGTSETRRFKLSHQDFGPVIRSKPETRDTGTEPHRPGSAESPAAGSGGSVASPMEAAAATARATGERSESGLSSELDNDDDDAERQRKAAAQTKREEALQRLEAERAEEAASGGAEGERYESQRQPAKPRAAQTTTDERRTAPSPKTSRLTEKETSELPTPDEPDSLSSPAAADGRQQKDERRRQTKTPSPMRVNSREAAASSVEEAANSSSAGTDRATSETAPTQSRGNEVAPTTTTTTTTPTRESSSQSAVKQLQDQERNQRQIDLPPTTKNTGTQSRALIPSVKTEVRVIIEIQDSKQRQRSELTSDSQLVDGKLSKKTQVTTSKQVAASPREVLNKLRSVGHEHSLLYQEGRQPATPPAALAAANQSALRWSSSLSSVASPTMSGGEALAPTTRTRRPAAAKLGHTGAQEAPERSLDTGWREVSSSSVRNEIETDTREQRRRGTGSSRHRSGGESAGRHRKWAPDGGQLEAAAAEEEQGSSSSNDVGTIVMSSDATINHMANDRSAIELKSRATKRYEPLERDPQTGRMVRSGRTSERVLVESQAGFNENDLSDRQAVATAAAAATVDQDGGQSQLTAERRQQRQQEQRERAEPPLQPATSRGDGRLMGRRMMSPREEGRSLFDEGRRREQQESVPFIRPSESATPDMATRFGQHRDQQRAQYTTVSPQPGQRHYQPPPAQPRVVSPPSLRQQQTDRPESRSPQPQPLPPLPAGTSHRSAHIEIEEETEDRHQVSKNGQLVYDDRLRERKYETQTTRSPPPVAPQAPDAELRRAQRQQPPQHHLLRGSSVSPGSPLSPGGILRNGGGGYAQQQQQQRQQQLLKPISLRASPPILFADQTSNLSSDPETMDSGFAQSGAGSSSALGHHHQALLNQQQQQQRQQQGGSRQPQQRSLVTTPMSPETMGAGHRRSRPASVAMQQQRQQEQQDELEGDAGSLTFVDDDVDELIDQLGGSRMLSPPVPPSTPSSSALGARRSAATHQADHLSAYPQQQRRMYPKAAEDPVTFRRPPADYGRQQAQQQSRGYLISPPPAFRSSEPALNKLRTLEAPPPVVTATTPSRARKQTSALVAPPSSGSNDTELTTRLTRTRRPLVDGPSGAVGVATRETSTSTRRTTLTKLEQNLVAPADGGGGAGGSVTGESSRRRAPNGMCLFKAQVVFESDTESMADRANSVASSSATGGGGHRLTSDHQRQRREALTRAAASGTRDKKELISETKYSSQSGGSSSSGPTKATGGAEDRLELGGQQQQGAASAEIRGGAAQVSASGVQGRSGGDLAAPRWDYSLRVNRMRGNKVDSKVNTYIKHSRQPLINS